MGCNVSKPTILDPMSDPSEKYKVKESNTIETNQTNDTHESFKADKYLDDSDADTDTDTYTEIPKKISTKIIPIDEFAKYQTIVSKRVIEIFDTDNELSTKLNELSEHMKYITEEIIIKNRLDILMHIMHMYDSGILQEINLYNHKNLKSICQIVMIIDSYADQRSKILQGLHLEKEDIYIEIQNIKTSLGISFKNKLTEKLTKISRLSASDTNSNASDIVALYCMYSKIPENCPYLLEITNNMIYQHISLYTMNIIEIILSETEPDIIISNSIKHIEGILNHLIPYIRFGNVSNEFDKFRLLKCFDDALDRLNKIISIYTTAETFGKIIQNIPKSQYKRFTTMYINYTLYSKLKEFLNNKNILDDSLKNVYNKCEILSKHIDPNIWNVLKQPAYRIIQILDSDESDIQNIFETMICSCSNPESYEQIKNIVNNMIKRKNLQIQLSDIMIPQTDVDNYDETDWKQRFVRYILPDIYRSISL